MFCIIYILRLTIVKGVLTWGMPEKCLLPESQMLKCTTTYIYYYQPIKKLSNKKDHNIVFINKIILIHITGTCYSYY